MYLFFKKGMRREVSYIFKKYSKANNKYLNILTYYILRRE